MKSSCRAELLGLITVLVLVGISVAFAQDSEVFGDKLGFVPITNATQGTISGTGTAIGTLNGNTLVIEGIFEGLSSPATAAHIHIAPPGQHGPVVFPLEVSNDTSGEITGTADLTDEQLQTLRDNNFYVMVHSQDNPGGELRAWLMSNYQAQAEGM